MLKNRAFTDFALTTKLSVPMKGARSDALLPLCEQFEKGVPRALTLVVAPPGCGKTSQVAQWLARFNMPVAWLNLDEYDNDTARFLYFFIAAVRRHYPEFAKHETRLLKTNKPPVLQSLLPSLLNQLRQAEQSIVVVLDNFEVINDSNILHAVHKVHEQLPQSVHWVVISRPSPHVDACARQLDQRVCVVRQHDLIPDISEPERQLNQQAQIATAMTGYDESLRDFLIKTSPLDKFSAALCDFVLERSDSKQCIEKLSVVSPIIDCLDTARRWYRYQETAAHLLHNELETHEPEIDVKIMRRAAQWHHMHGNFDEAMRYALKAGQLEMVARWLDECFDDYFMCGRVKTLLDWFSRLPDELIQENPSRIMSFVWVMLTARTLVFHDFLDHAERMLSEDTQFARYPMDLHRRIRGQMDLCRGVDALAHAKFRHAIALLESALPLLEETEFAFLELPLLYLGVCYNRVGDMFLARDYLEQAYDISLQQNNLAVLSGAGIGLAFLYHKLGKCHEAQQIIGNTLEDFADLGLQNFSEHAWLNLAQAILYFENYDLRECERCFGADWTFMELSGNEQFQIYFKLNNAALGVARGDLHQARKLMAETLKHDELPRMLNVLPVLPDPIVLRMKLFLRLGDLSPVSIWADGQNFQYDSQREPELLLLTRYFAALGQAEECNMLLMEMVDDARSNGRQSVVVEALVLQSIMHYQAGDTDAACRSLKDALEIGVPKGFLRLLVEDFTAVEPLLQVLAKESDDCAQLASRIIHMARG